MRKLKAAVLTLVFTSVLTFAFTLSTSSVAADSCSCTAPDGSCSASITCTRGCIEHCANNGDCYARCSGFYGSFGSEFSLQRQNATYPQLVAELARVSGYDLAFFPVKRDTIFNLDYKRAVLWDVLEILSDRGTVQIAGQDFEKLKRLRRILLSGERISLCVQNTPVSTFVNDTASLTGLPLRITAGRPMAIVNVKLQNVTLNEILVKVSEQTGTKIIEEGADPDAQ
jgi:hypothetical protein